MQLYLGDCLDILRTLPDNSVDSIVTDPPYGLEFMGRKWDYHVPSVEIWAECLRVLKPGGHLLAFAGTRTQHRMCVRIEDAGFEIRDMIAWVYGSGFPKSHNGEWGGTALKPALEPITLARKPLIGTVAANVVEHGTGGLNIDGCRVGWPDGKVPEIGTPNWGGPSKMLSAAPGVEGETVERAPPSILGRWPANLIHDGSDEVLAAFPIAPGQMGKARDDGGPQNNAVYGALAHVTKSPEPRNDAGSAARFFYVAKASRKDRNEGCEGMEQKMPKGDNGAENAVSSNRGSRSGPRENHHPTVKPTELMRYLCRLVTPPGGIVLDPFAGSGSTGKGALLEGRQFIGIERELEYWLIAHARLSAIDTSVSTG